MALDSADKRAGAIAFKQVAMPLYPMPDGDIDTAADRQLMAREYPGIAASTVVTAGMMWRHHAYGL